MYLLIFYQCVSFSQKIRHCLLHLRIVGVTDIAQKRNIIAYIRVDLGGLKRVCY